MTNRDADAEKLARASDADDEPGCDCGMDDCPECDGSCWRCGGAGEGVEGEDWDATDPLWIAPGEVVRCNACGGTGKARDVVYW